MDKPGPSKIYSEKLNFPEIHNSENSSNFCTVKDTDIHEEKEIPVVTFHTKFLLGPNPASIFKAYILQLINSKLIEKNPFIYKFRDIRYSYVKISGTIISRKLQVNEGFSFVVADETACIECISFSNEKLKLCRKEANQFSRNGNHKVEDKYLKQAGDLILKKCLTKLNDFPKYTDINLGDKVIVIGQLKEKCERLIVAWNIQRLRPVRQEFHKG